MPEEQERRTRPEELPSLSDEDLAELGQQGRQRALRELRERFLRPLARFIYRYVRDPNLALEMAEDSLTDALLAIKTYRRDHKVRSWLFAIARHRVIDSDRHITAEKVALDDNPMADTPEMIGAPIQLSDQRDDTLRHLHSSEMAALVEKAAGELPPDQRQAVLLRDAEGYTYQEIAEILEVPLATATTWIHRARLYIRKRLAEAGHA